MPVAARVPGWLAGRAALLTLLLAMCPWGAHARAEDPPPAPPLPPVVPAPAPAVPMGAVRTDTAGVCTRLLEEAAAELEAEKPERAADRLAAAWEKSPEVLVPAPAHLAGTENLRWPVADVVEAMAGLLPQPRIAPLAQRVRAGSAALDLARAAEGDREALRRVCRAPVVTDAEVDALVALAEHEREAGRHEIAAALLSRWLRARPQAPLEARARVVGRLAEALEVVGDEAALGRLLATLPGPRTEPEGEVEDPALTALRRRVEDVLRRVQRPTAAQPDEFRVPQSLAVLWALDLSDPGLRWAGDFDVSPVTTGVHAEADLVLVHAARTVRRVDPLTGRVRWAFPAGAQGWDYDPRTKYQPHDLPLRCVTRAGDLALAVLGDPGGVGAFPHQGQDVEIAGSARESRARLVALDLETGALRWTSGGARERHPVLSDRATVCSSPPLVVGERIYVLFGRRFGTVEHYAACLERRTGALLWLAFLGTGESGWDPGLESFGRSDRAAVRAVPFGARPTLEAGELCVTPHAAFAAGLDPASGVVRWVRALPRYPMERHTTRPHLWGHSGRNQPVAVPGGWVLAPLDAPTMLALERGTGILSWNLPLPEDGERPRYRDLLGLASGPDGRAAVRVSGERLVQVDPFHGTIRALGGEWDGQSGSVLDLGSVAVRSVDLRLAFARWVASPDASDPQPSLTSWDESEQRAMGADVHRAGNVWLLAGNERLIAYAEKEPALAALAAVAADGAGTAPARAAALAVAARIGAPLEGLSAALEEAGQDAGARAVVAESLLATLRQAARRDAEPEGFGGVLRVLERLPAPQRDQAFQIAAETLFAAGRDDEVVALLARWIDAPPGLVEVPLPPDSPPDDPDGEASLDPDLARLRGDLVAAGAMKRLRAAGRGLAALEARERATEGLVAKAESGPDALAALPEAIRRAAGTPAASTGREHLVRRLVEAGRFGDAAAVAADLRLDPPAAAEPATARAWAARWQVREAAWLAKAGDDVGARSLLADLLRWVPSGTKDDEGRTASDLLALVRGRSGFGVSGTARPLKTIDVWRGIARPHDREDVRGVVYLGVEGPGAGLLGERFVLARGLTLEVWSAATGERVAELPGEDEGWFGGGLQDLTPWLPERGVRITHLVAGEPADRSGVEVGDWVTSFGGAPLAGTADFMARIATAPPGRPQAIEALRAGEPVVTSLTPGRRPIAEGGFAVDRSRVWAAPDGRLLVPGRTGLAWLDVRRPARTPFWRWSGPGTVQHVDVVAGAACVLVRRLHDDDLIVSVDLSTGAERWRRALHGPIAWIQGTGSALHVQADDPARAFVLDRADGSVRAALPRLVHPPRLSSVGIGTFERIETAASAAGRLWLLRGRLRRFAADGVASLDVLNTTTCEPKAVSREPLHFDPTQLLLPSIAADAYVAVIEGGPLVRVFEPDPVADRVLGFTDLGEGDLLTEQDHHGGLLDLDSRVLVGGRTVYVVRNRGRGLNGRGVTVMVFEPHEDAQARRPRFRFVDLDPPLLSGAREPILQSIDLHPDGLLLAAVDFERTEANDYRRGFVWIAASEGEPGLRESGLRSWEALVTQPRRGPAVRSGAWIFVPTDKGADLVPVVPGAPR